MKLIVDLKQNLTEFQWKDLSENIFLHLWYEKL